MNPNCMCCRSAVQRTGLCGHRPAECRRRSPPWGSATATFMSGSKGSRRGGGTLMVKDDGWRKKMTTVGQGSGAPGHSTMWEAPRRLWEARVPPECAPAGSKVLFGDCYHYCNSSLFWVRTGALESRTDVTLSSLVSQQLAGKVPGELPAHDFIPPSQGLLWERLGVSLDTGEEKGPLWKLAPAQSSWTMWWFHSLFPIHGESKHLALLPHHCHNHTRLLYTNASLSMT